METTLTIHVPPKFQEASSNFKLHIIRSQSHSISKQLTPKESAKTYFRVASALSIVTLSSVASRLGRPRSKYLMSKSKNGKISCNIFKQIYTYNQFHTHLNAKTKISILSTLCVEPKTTIITLSLIDCQKTRVISSPALSNKKISENVIKSTFSKVIKRF